MCSSTFLKRSLNVWLLLRHQNFVDGIDTTCQILVLCLYCSEFGSDQQRYICQNFVTPKMRHFLSSSCFSGNSEVSLAAHIQGAMNAGLLPTQGSLERIGSLSISQLLANIPGLPILWSRSFSSYFLPNSIRFVFSLFKNEWKRIHCSLHKKKSV